MKNYRLHRLCFICLFSLNSTPLLAHHGVAGLGTAGLRGPGAPIEAATSSTLPADSSFAYLKLDHARYETYDSDPGNPESDYANYWMLGLGHGFTPWLSVYAFLPYPDKQDESGGYSTRGVADVSLFGQLGFKYDEGWLLNPGTESLDDMEDWHFTVFGGLTLPTGDANLRDSNGDIDPGKSTGFGKSSWSLGVTATRMLASRWTFNQEVSMIRFQEYTYDDGNRTLFGSETRANSALVYRAQTDMQNNYRMDLVLEAQYLKLGRDRSNGVAEEATGGEMIYLLPGVRFYKGNLSAAVGVKTPVWTELNEEDDQQGGEGTEDYRLILTFSALF